jgi:two-component system phosphate regulon sensor histidine kinase PhoR
MKPVIRKGMVAPGIVAFVTLIVWAVFGPRWALAALGVGAATIIGVHLYYLQLATDWAAGSLEAPVPEGRGSWAEAFSALHRRTRMRVALQRDLKSVIQRFRKAAEALPDGVVLLDASNRIEWANLRAEEQLGLNLATDRRQPLVNLVRHPEFLRYIESGDYRESAIVEQPLQRRTLALQLVPFGMEEKLLLSRDVTQLEALARMRRDFIANVSHELKTPLTVVTGFLETLQDMEFEPRQRTRYLRLMEDQARNMQRLVDDLLALSSLESEHNPLQDAEFAVVPVLLELSADAKALSQGEHTITLDIGESAVIIGSRDELKSAIGNLVSNAIRYTPQGGAITLTWQVEDSGSGVFTVRDTGIGIAPEHIPRLTERFYRVDRSRSRATGGTGLGLAIVKHVLLRHQAELDIESQLGEGSTFSVRLPARRVRRIAEIPPEASIEGVPASALVQEGADERRRVGFDGSVR